MPTHKLGDFGKSDSPLHKRGDHNKIRSDCLTLVNNFYQQTGRGNLRIQNNVVLTSVVETNVVQLDVVPYNGHRTRIHSDCNHTNGYLDECSWSVFENAVVESSSLQFKWKNKPIKLQ
jgi:hypothetical protein